MYMKKSILMMMALVLMVSGAFAQKIDQRLTRLVEQTAQRRAQGLVPLDAKAVNKSIAVDFNADGSIRAFSAIGTLNKDAECPTAQLEAMGIKVRYQIGDVVALVIPADKLTALEQVEEFSFVKADEMAQPTNMMARLSTNAFSLTNDQTAKEAGLPRVYTGKDIVLGIIDQGIDFNHAAFRNADGSTRIKKAIIYTSATGDYQEYNNEAEIKALTADNTQTSHGTHTSSTAGGTETGNFQQGVAPEVDLVLVGLGQFSANTNIAQAIQKIFDYATSAGKPAVVSISMGNIIGLHDGSDNVTKAVATLTENGNKQGRAVLISSSNSAGNWQSVLVTGTTEKKTVLGSASYPTTQAPTVPVAYNGLYFFYASDGQDFDLSLKLVDIQTGQVLDNLGNHVLNLADDKVADLKLMHGNDLKDINGKNVWYYFLDTSSVPVRMDDGQWRLALYVKPGNATQTVKMICNGDTYLEPCFDAPTDGGYNFPANGWTKGNADFAFNVMACNDAVISVGSYISNNSWSDFLNRTFSYPASKVTGKEQVVGEISDFSSYGIDDNSKPRPTVLGPGQGLISGANNYDVSMFKEGQPGVVDIDNPNKKNALYFLCDKVDKNSRANWYVLEQGTSMSCPHTAGIVALWMQAKPTLTVNEIKDAMKASCVNDDFTTNTAMIPSGNKVQAGYGKVDAVAGLKKILGTTGIQTIEVGGHRQATPATMYNVDAPVYNMLGQRVDKAQKGLVIYKGRKYVNK